MEDDLRYDLSADKLASAVSRPQTVQGKIYRLIPDSARILDVGCHTGGLGNLLKQRGCSVTGMERNAKAAEHAKKVMDHVVIGDVEQETPWKELSNGFDAILFLDVLEHCREPEKVLRAARARLAPGGFVLSSIPNVAHWSVRGSLFWGKFDYQPRGILDETHLRFYTIDSAHRLFASAGYRIGFVDFVFTAPKLFRQRIIPNALAKRIPGLFAYQMILKASPETKALR